MQGGEVFESVGAAAAEKVKGTDSDPAEPTAPPEDQKPTSFRRKNVAKQSGVPNIIWNNGLRSWEVDFGEYDAKGQKIRRTKRQFAVKKFMGPGRSAEEADATALQAARTFRAELVKQGILSEPKVKDPNFTSEVPGVQWTKRQQKWHVEIWLKGSKKKISCGYFTEKDAAEAKALELREQHGVQRHVKATNSLATLPVFHPKVPSVGVSWDQARQQWHATCAVQGILRNIRIRPKDHSEEELERSFKVAVTWRKKQEKEKKEGKAVKPKVKVKPGKKPPK